MTENEYDQKLLAVCLETKVEVISLANHGSVDGSNQLRKLFNDNGIMVFLGFEIASSEKIHFVCLFDETKTSQELEKILENLELPDPQNGIWPSRLSAEQLIDNVNQKGGFIFAAHSINDNGILKRRMNHIMAT